MEHDFPVSTSKYIKADIFQDSEITLIYKGWDKKGNEDRPGKSTWKDNLKYQLRYSYPEWAIDTTTGEKMLDKNGNPFKNSNYDPKYPQGYSIIYHFEEGQLESGSLPLFKAFSMVRPAPGDRVCISRTGKDKETKWKVRRVVKGEPHSVSMSDIPTIQIDEEEQPF